MIRFIPTSGAEVAETLTEALWALSRPASVRGVTSQMFPTITATDGSVWLVVDTEFSIPVHAEAELGEITGILQPWIDAELLGAGTIETLAAYIETMRGQRMNVWEVFPQLFKDQSRTREELLAAGLLEEPIPTS